MLNQKHLAIITQNPIMRDILNKIRKISDSNSSVLLIGETGVGKEIFAEFIHRTSSRANQPFVKIGLNSLPGDLMGSELFGHEKGAYTSASSVKKGLFEIANGGSIFLDDIDDVPLDIQTKLLRVLESRELMRVGGTDTIPIDVRLITASKVDLKELIKKGIFRSDLFYRINVVPLNSPPLRERRDDIPLLIEHFLKYYQPHKNYSLTKEALRALIHYHFPGNVRELKNIIHRITLFVENDIGIDDLPNDIKNQNSTEALLKACNNCFIEGQMSMNQIITCLEKNLINETLKNTKGNKSKAAKELGLNLSTFRDKLKKYQ